MQNVSVSAMLAPIYYSFGTQDGLSPVPFIILIAVASNMAIATPIGTPVNMQILPAGINLVITLNWGALMVVIHDCGLPNSAFPAILERNLE